MTWHVKWKMRKINWHRFSASFCAGLESWMVLILDPPNTCNVQEFSPGFRNRRSLTSFWGACPVGSRGQPGGMCPLLKWKIWWYCWWKKSCTRWYMDNLPLFTWYMLINCTSANLGQLQPKWITKKKNSKEVLGVGSDQCDWLNVWTFGVLWDGTGLPDDHMFFWVLRMFLCQIVSILSWRKVNLAGICRNKRW